jgi:hypothetical protein
MTVQTSRGRRAPDPTYRKDKSFARGSNGRMVLKMGGTYLDTGEVRKAKGLAVRSLEVSLKKLLINKQNIGDSYYSQQQFG